jgi:hypothetical protein
LLATVTSLHAVDAEHNMTCWCCVFLRSPPPPSLNRSLAAALVEGEHEVQLIRVDHSSCKLALLQKLTLESVKFPCATSWDTQGRLWVVGGPPLDTSKSLHLGAAAAATQGV